MPLFAGPGAMGITDLNANGIRLQTFPEVGAAIQQDHMDLFAGEFVQALRQELATDSDIPFSHSAKIAKSGFRYSAVLNKFHADPVLSESSQAASGPVPKLKNMAIDIRDEVLVNATPEACFKVVEDFAGYPRWWPKALRPQHVKNGKKGIGSVVTFSPGPGFTIGWEMEQLDPPHELRIRYVRAWHTGWGKWTFEEKGGQTLVAYTVGLEPKNKAVALFYRMIQLPKQHSRHMNRAFDGLRNLVESK